MSRRRPEFSDAFAVVLQRRRIARKLSRQALAQKAGLHQTYIGLIERCVSNPSLDTAKAIAEALEVPLSQLIAESEMEHSALSGARTDPKIRSNSFFILRFG
jgi:transcriptional regulator with XRE-family HTH domain